MNNRISKTRKNQFLSLSLQKNSIRKRKYHLLCIILECSMIIICDAPGQTCNRLWTYVASVAQCVAERKRMAILFFDWTIEDFPNLLHAPFIYYPLWHKWYLERVTTRHGIKSSTSSASPKDGLQGQTPAIFNRHCQN